jgi:hypothetical protein
MKKAKKNTNIIHIFVIAYGEKSHIILSTHLFPFTSNIIKMFSELGRLYRYVASSDLNLLDKAIVISPQLTDLTLELFLSFTRPHLTSDAVFCHYHIVRPAM